MNSLALWFMPRSRYLFFLTDYCKKYNDYKEIDRASDTPTGQSGGKTNENAVLKGKGTKKTYYLGPNGEIVHSAYKRLLIRRKR